MRATVIVRLKRIRDDVVRRKVIVEFDGFLIDVQVAWESASAPARLPNNFNGMHEIYITQEHRFPHRLKILSRVFRFRAPPALLSYFRSGLSEDLKALQRSKWPCVSYSRGLSFPQALQLGCLADKISCSELDMSNGTLEFRHAFILIS